MARKAASQPTATSVPSLVKDLVDQFDQPLDFYRELIQNSIDAGSNRIDIRLEHDGKIATISVEDDGEGMDENIIDNFLLVLFRSSKDSDFTKIGKFGIGFVSVFAPRPDRVRIFTAKNGESWRLDFPSFKRYEKYRLTNMRDGTLVELTKTMTPEEFTKLVEDSRKTIRYWCKHSEARVLFCPAGAQPEELTEPFGLPGEGLNRASLTHAEEGTEIQLAFDDAERPFFGFYNRGLTLKEGEKVYFPGTRFKAKSRYLEHTLTRDNVIEDDNYRKLMKIVGELHESRLPDILRRELKAISMEISKTAGALAPGQNDPRLALLSQGWSRRSVYLRWLFSGYFSRWRRLDWRIFPSLSGQAVSLDEISDQAEDTGALYFDSSQNPVTREIQKLHGAGALPAGPWVDCAASWLGLKAVHASKELMLPKVLPDAQLGPELRRYLETLREVDSRSGAKYRAIHAADLAYPASAVADEMFVTQKDPGSLSPIKEPVTLSLFPGGRRHALLNVTHPSVKQLARLHAAQPGLAAYLTLKTLHLHDGKIPADQQSQYTNLAEKMEAQLLKAALKLDAPGGPA